MYRVTIATCGPSQVAKKNKSACTTQNLAMDGDLIKSIDADFDERSAGMAC